jgi:Domain of unknown function (DUF4259)
MMGAWGTDPFDNDSALDWLDFIERPIVREIETTLLAACWSKEEGNGAGYHEAIAAAALLLRLTKPESIPNVSYNAMQRDVFDKALDVMRRIFADKEWSNSWDSPRSIRRVLSALISGIAQRRERLLKQRAAVVKRKFHGCAKRRKRSKPK